MKRGLMLLAGLAILGPLGPVNALWFPYGSVIPHSAGNRNWDPYAGQPGSTYDTAANPPQTIGTVSYNPYGPLPPVSPATPSGSASTAMTAPR
jgi:hypothetical protein